MYPADDSVSHCRVEVRCQQERIADRVSPVADLYFVAVADLRRWKVVATEQPDQRHVACGIDSDDDRVVEDSVIETALHEVARTAGDVKVTECVTVGANDDSRSATLAAVSEDGHHGG